MPWFIQLTCPRKQTGNYWTEEEDSEKRKGAKLQQGRVGQWQGPCLPARILKILICWFWAVWACGSNKLSEPQLHQWNINRYFFFTSLSWELRKIQTRNVLCKLYSIQPQILSFWKVKVPLKIRSRPSPLGQRYTHTHLSTQNVSGVIAPWGISLNFLGVYASQMNSSYFRQTQISLQLFAVLLLSF